MTGGNASFSPIIIVYCLPINTLPPSFWDPDFSTKENGFLGNDFHILQFAQRLIISMASDHVTPYTGLSVMIDVLREARCVLRKIR